MAESNDSEFYEKELNRHCRVCAGVVENTYTYTCHEETNKTLLQNFGIDVDKDQPNVHPKVFCLCCRTKATQYSECTASALKVFQWTLDTELSSSCEVCYFFKKQKKGGRSKKERKNRGRPRSQHIVNRILLHATHIYSHGKRLLH